MEVARTFLDNMVYSVYIVKGETLLERATENVSKRRGLCWKGKKEQGAIDPDFMMHRAFARKPGSGDDPDQRRHKVGCLGSRPVSMLFCPPVSAFSAATVVH